MLSVIKTDIKNLQDISPLVDQDVIDNYNAKYGKYTTVKKPNFVNGLTEVTINDTDEHGKDVLHSRPRSAPGSAGGSLSGSDDEKDGAGSRVSVVSNTKFSPEILNNLVQIHSFNGGNGTGSGSNSLSPNTPINVNAHSLNSEYVQSSGMSQQSQGSRRSNISSANSQRNQYNGGDGNDIWGGGNFRIQPNLNVTASLETLSAPSLLNTFNNIQQQSRNQTPRSGSGNDNVIITVEPDNENGAM
jgi:hypothetical protein